MASEKPSKFVLVLMPFDPSFNDIYHLGIKEACRMAGADCERIDEQIFQDSILQRIYEQISYSDLIISDMTGRNPNVFYETGYARGLGKKIIFLTQNADDIPFDLKHYPHIVYEGKIIKLKDQLQRHVEVYLKNSGSSQEAHALLRRSPPEMVKQLQELIFTIQLHKESNHPEDIKRVLLDAKKVFANPQIISEEAVSQALDEADRLAEELLADFSDENVITDWDAATQRMRIIFGPLFRILPSLNECTDRILKTDKAVLAPFLVTRFFSAMYRNEREPVFHLIQRSGLGREILPVLEHIARNGQYPQWDFSAAIGMARVLLRDEFDVWYREIRGKSAEEERAAYEQGEKERSETSRRESERRMKEWLDEFTPDASGNPVHRPQNVKILIKQLTKLKSQLDSIQISNPASRRDVSTIAHKAKYLIKPFDFESGYRIHKAQIAQNEEGLFFVVNAEVELQLEKADFYVAE